MSVAPLLSLQKFSGLPEVQTILGFLLLLLPGATKVYNPQIPLLRIQQIFNRKCMLLDVTI